MNEHLTSNLIDIASELYVDKSLTYHNWDHIESMFSTYRELFGAISHEEELGIAFHDVVYIPGAGPELNEDLSKLVFERHYQRQKGFFDDASIDAQLVKDIIESTKIKHHLSHEVRKGPCARVMDCDLASLGDSSYERFLERQDRIIFEYAGCLNKTEYKQALEKSARFLVHFLMKPNIYHTKEAREKFEAQARQNITKFCKKHINLETGTSQP